MSYGTSIVTSGLVLLYDEDNIRSYRGPLMTNLLNQITTNASDNGSTFRFFAGTEDVYVPQVGNVNACKYIDMYNDYNGGSNNCCPNPYTFGSPSVTGNTEYTYAILYKSVNRYTHPNYMYHYEFGPSGYLTEYGLFYTQGSYSGSERHLGDGWYWASSKFTSNAAATSFQCYAFMYQYATWNRFYVANVLLAQGDHLNLHPRYWPSVGQGRTNTQILTDLTNNNPLTVSNLTYANDGTFSFNNSSSVVTMPNNAVLNPTTGVTIEAWVNFSGNSDDFIFEKGDVNTQYSLFSHGTDIVFRTFHSGDGSYHSQDPSKSAVGISNGVPVHIVGSWDGATKRIYVNGVLRDSVSKTGNLVTTTPGASIGRFGGNTSGYFFGGSIYKVSVYNRGLTELEVLQNFNALRGRFNL